MFIVKLQARKSSSVLTLICIKSVPGDPSTVFVATSFTRKMPNSSNSMYSSIFMLGNIWYYNFTWSGPSLQEIVYFISIYFGSQKTRIGAKFTISCEFGPLQVKLWYTFSSMKMEEYMKFELTVFWAELLL